jgi:large subunit ribosomal protein L29
MDELVDLRREQFNLRMQQSTDEMTRNHEHGRVRKDIARIKTVISEQKRAASAEEGK